MTHRPEHAPAPLTSLIASATRVTGKTMGDRAGGWGMKPDAWVDDAWEMYDLVGEQRFLATTLAGRIAQAGLYVGKLAEDPTDPPEPVDQEHIGYQVFANFGASPSARAQMIARLGINLFVAGDGWFVGIPKHLLPHSTAEAPDDDGGPLQDLEELEWRTLSVSEVAFTQREVKLSLGDGEREKVETAPDNLLLIRVWRPHPRRWWESDSPTRSSLPVLRELVGLTMHVSAQVDSRLAGAGVFIVPQSAARALATAAGLDPDSDEDVFTEALMESMLTPISDRSNASALVPLVVTVPDDAASLFQHITFSNPLDAEARELRDEAIRRLALGQDAPPELLLGQGSMNHWGAWLVREDVVTTHIEPPLSLICDALTSQFLWPVLIESGMTEDEAREYVVWYDVSRMVMRPNRLADAQSLHAVGAISDEALRDAGGFSEADAPPRLNEAVEIAIEMAKSNPALVDNMKEIIAAFNEVLNPAETRTETLPESPTETGEDVTVAAEGEPPEDTGTEDGGEEQIAASGPPDVDTTTVVVALPAEDDPIHQIGPENKHATLAFLGELANPDDAAGIAQAIERDLAPDLKPFTAAVESRELLGDDDPQAEVLKLATGDSDIEQIRGAVIRQDAIREPYEAIRQWVRFQPHVTLGYGDQVTDADRDAADQIREIRFDRIALWNGEEQTEWPLGT